MLDFDFLSKRSPSVCCIIYPFASASTFKHFFFGSKDINIPVYDNTCEVLQLILSFLTKILYISEELTKIYQKIIKINQKCLKINQNNLKIFQIKLNISKNPSYPPLKH